MLLAVSSNCENKTFPKACVHCRQGTKRTRRPAGLSQAAYSAYAHIFAALSSVTDPSPSNVSSWCSPCNRLCKAINIRSNSVCRLTGRSIQSALSVVKVSAKLASLWPTVRTSLRHSLNNPFCYWNTVMLLNITKNYYACFVLRQCPATITPCNCSWDCTWSLF